MWKARHQRIPSGARYHVFHGGSQLSFREFFTLLEMEPAFARWYANTLASTDFAAFFWELPPLSEETFDDDAEFVLIESPSLARLRPDPAPFESHFARHSRSDVIAFPNLGGDALLVVPQPVGSIDVYAHLAAFLRGAPDSQVVALWKAAARVARENLSPQPRWLSTAGLGVAWLHLRLDTYPKYYRFEPYRLLPNERQP